MTKGRDSFGLVLSSFLLSVQAWLWAVLVCCIFWLPLGSLEQQAVPREDPLCSFVTEENLPGGSCVSCCCDVTGTLPRPRRVPVAVGHGALSVQSGSGRPLVAGGSSCPRHSQQPAQPLTGVLLCLQGYSLRRVQHGQNDPASRCCRLHSVLCGLFGLFFSPLGT